jgi:hypothetical protein
MIHVYAHHVETHYIAVVIFSLPEQSLSLSEGLSVQLALEIAEGFVLARNVSISILSELSPG